MKLNALVKSPDFQNQLWTLISMGMVVAFPTILDITMTHQIGLAYAGMFLFARAVTDLPVQFTLFNVRLVQNVDVTQKVPFNVYLGHRTAFAFIASVLFSAFLLLSHFELISFFSEENPINPTVILPVFFIFMSNIYADVFLGDLQQKGNMRIAGKIQASVFCGALIIAIIVLLLTNSLVATLISAAIVVFLGYLTWIWLYRKHFGKIRISFDFSAIKKLTLTVFPIFITGFLFVYLFNSPKYYLAFFENHYPANFTSEELVGIYGFMLMPVALLNIASTGFFSGPVATKTAGIYASNKIMQFKKRINMMLLLALGLFFPFIIVVYFWGVPILSWIYETDFVPFRTAFLLLSIGGIARAPNYVLTPVLIMLGKQKAMLYSSILVAVIAGPVLFWLVSSYGIFGAAFSTFVLFLPQTVINYIIYRRTINLNDGGMPPENARQQESLNS